MPPTESLPWKVEELEKDRDREIERLDDVAKLADKHELELHGERGVNATLKDLSDRMVWLTRALWGLGASITLASFVFALNALGGGT